MKEKLFASENRRDERERVFRSRTYKPFLTFSGGIAVWALTEKNHTGTVIRMYCTHTHIYRYRSNLQQRSSLNNTNVSLEKIIAVFEAKHVA